MIRRFMGTGRTDLLAMSALLAWQRKKMSGLRLWRGGAAIIVPGLDNTQTSSFAT